MTDAEFDPYSYEVHDNPYPYYRALREQKPVYHNDQYGFYLLTKWEDVRNALRDFRSFTSDEGVSLDVDATIALGFPQMITQSPPKQTRMRRVVADLMTPEHVAAFEPFIREKSIALLEPHMAAGKIDLIADFSCFLPMAVISRIIFIPESDEDMVRGWTDALIYREEGQNDLSESNANAWMNLANYFDEFANRHAANPPEGDNVLSRIVHAEAAGELTHDEVIGYLILLALAGNETTTKLIGNMAHRLWEHKEQRAMLVADPSLIPNAVEETMRYDGSTQLMGRTVTADVEIRGTLIPKGSRVGLCLIAANRDEDKFPDAETFDITRDATGHLGFGFGPHACLGAALARLEAKVAMEEILKRMPEYEIDFSGADRTHNPNVRGYTHLPLRFEVR